MICLVFGKPLQGYYGRFILTPSFTGGYSWRTPTEFKCIIIPLFQLLRPLRQIPKNPINQITLRPHNHPRRQKHQHQIRIQRNMLLIPQLQLPLIRRNMRFIKLCNRHRRGRHQLLLIPEYNRSNPGQSRSNIIDRFFDMIRIRIKSLIHQWPWPHDTHIPLEDIDNLRQLIDFRFTQKMPHWHKPWIFPRSMQSRSQAWTCFQHGCKLPHREHPVFKTNPVLKIKHIMFPGEQQPNTHRNQHRQNNHQCHQCNHKIYNTFKKIPIHSVF